MEKLILPEVEEFVRTDELPNGSGDGSGEGYGDGSGYGYGSGDGSGDGYGYGDGSNIEYFNGSKVYIVDGVQTLIDSVHVNYAKGRMLRTDLTTEECYIAKCGNFFAHGETLKQATAEARAKYERNAPLEERIARFNEQYPDRDVEVPAAELFSWHNVLTGSCTLGRKSFCEQHGLDYVNGRYTVNQFISLTRNAYGGEVIRMLEKTEFKKNV